MDVCRISQEKSGWILLMILNEIIHFLGELLDWYEFVILLCSTFSKLLFEMLFLASIFKKSFRSHAE